VSEAVQRQDRTKRDTLRELKGEGELRGGRGHTKLCSVTRPQSRGEIMEGLEELMSHQSQLARLYITLHPDQSGSRPGRAWAFSRKEGGVR
ncbi:hypothetical protein JOQ06_023080, partial [Pogonophryne albipinna]